MSYRGRVINGMVVLEDSRALPEGTAVSVQALNEGKRRRKKLPRAAPDIWTKLLKLAGTAKGLPADLARNHDHYAHGAPRR